MVEAATRHLTILLSDIKGFTDRTAHMSRTRITALLDEHRAVVLPPLEARGGRLIKTIGDAYLVIFESPTDAVLAAVDVQNALAKRNEGHAPDDRIEIRLALNAGEVNLIDGDVYGEAVNITARVESIAEAGQVYFTEAVFLAMNKAEVQATEVGLASLKGIPQKIRVYKVGPASGRRLPSAASARSEKASFVGGAGLLSHWRRAAALALDLILCGGIAAGYFFLATRVTSVPRKVALKPPPAAAPAPLAPGVGVGDQFLRNLHEAFHAPPKKKPSPTFTLVYDEKLERPSRKSTVGVFALACLAFGLLFALLKVATPGQRALRPRVAAR
jgi:class 3 adenylate cyclase